MAFYLSAKPYGSEGAACVDVLRNDARGDRSHPLASCDIYHLYPNGVGGLVVTSTVAWPGCLCLPSLVTAQWI